MHEDKEQGEVVLEGLCTLHPNQFVTGTPHYFDADFHLSEQYSDSADEGIRVGLRWDDIFRSTVDNDALYYVVASVSPNYLLDPFNLAINKVTAFPQRGVPYVPTTYRNLASFHLIGDIRKVWFGLVSLWSLLICLQCLRVVSTSIHDHPYPLMRVAGAILYRRKADGCTFTMRPTPYTDALDKPAPIMVNVRLINSVIETHPNPYPPQNAFVVVSGRVRNVPRVQYGTQEDHFCFDLYADSLVWKY
jgi:hypothetical protein